MFIKNILATDMKNHTDLLKDFKREFLDTAKTPKIMKSPDPTNFSEASQSKQKAEKTEEQIILITSLFTHVADLSGPVKKYNIAYGWSKRVNAEFSNQVEEEIRLNLPVTSYFKNLDDSEVYYKGEQGFMKFII